MEVWRIRRAGIVVVLILGLMAASVALAHHRILRGKAYYYANKYVGQTMACGGTYQHDKMVAAHRRLPCGTRLRVKNVRNGRRVTVTVKDRGPFGDEDFILDLSRGAARKLRFVRAGTARVRAVVLHD